LATLSDPPRAIGRRRGDHAVPSTERVAAHRRPDLEMNLQIKRKIAFALLMGIVTTGIISFILVAVNLGFSSGFAAAWLRSWGIAYLVVIPAILLVGPPLQARVDRWIS
jgi:hypothetical protein